jgi:predicted metalloprotease with PDZ domain
MARRKRTPRDRAHGQGADYRAVVRAANQARVASDYAFFTDTQLFLLPDGHRSRPSVLRFDVPSGWRIASGLDETADPTVFTASTQHRVGCYSRAPADSK